jgi:hypothetical protein
MSAKRLGRFAAGLFVVLGLAIGGSLGGGKSVTSDAVNAATINVVATQFDLEWH